MNRLYLLVIALVSFSIASSGQQGEWTWISGSNTIDGTVTYGTQGVPSVNNTPPGLYEACEWTDTSGMFWLYGGESITSSYANLWRYNPATNEWTWVKGPGNGGGSPVYGIQGVPDPANTPGTRALCTTSFTGKDGSLWLFGGYGSGGPYNDLWKYDIPTNEWTWMKGPNTANDPGSYGTQGVPSPNNLPPSRSECSMSWTDSVGNLWLFGGWNNSDSYNDLWKYDPVTNEWTWMKGSSFGGASGVYGTKGVPGLTNTPGGRNAYTKWNDGHNLFLFGGDRFATGSLYNDVWEYIISTNEWVWISGTKNANNNGSASSQCLSDVDDYPSCRREGRFCWVDCAQKFWLFGGSSHGSFDGSHNDLWRFDPVSLEWTWASGSLNTLQSGSFGTKGVSSPANVPPSKSGGNTWTDNDGNLWLFGGTDVNWPHAWNDLWRYVPDTACGGTNCVINSPPIPGFASSDTGVCEKFCIDFFDMSSNNPTSWLWTFEGGSPYTSTQKNPAAICYDVPGMYDVTLISSNAIGSDTLSLPDFITVFATPPAPVIDVTGNVLTCSSASTYQWQFNTIDIPGATDQSYTATQSGVYTVMVTDENGCLNFASVKITVSGVDNLTSGFDVEVFPNPSNGNFVIQSLSGSTDLNASINIVNAIGQLIYSAEESITPSFRKEINLTGIAEGVYFLELKSENIFLKKKIIILSKK